MTRSFLLGIATALAVGLAGASMSSTADAQKLKGKGKSPVPWAGCCSSCTNTGGGWRCTGCSERVGDKCGPTKLSATCTTSSDTTLCVPKTQSPKKNGIKAR